jgi:mercuric ion transport protein
MTVQEKEGTRSGARLPPTQNLFDATARIGDHSAKVGVSRVLAVGGILTALGAASCCVIPFALFTLGVSGAWIGNLTALEPYQPIFAFLAVVFIGYGAYRVSSKPKAACVPDSYCADPKSDRLAKLGLWAATGLVIVAVSFPYLIRTLAF